MTADAVSGKIDLHTKQHTSYAGDLYLTANASGSSLSGDSVTRMVQEFDRLPQPCEMDIDKQISTAVLRAVGCLTKARQLMDFVERYGVHFHTAHWRMIEVRRRILSQQLLLRRANSLLADTAPAMSGSAASRSTAPLFVFGRLLESLFQLSIEQLSACELILPGNSPDKVSLFIDFIDCACALHGNRLPDGSIFSCSTETEAVAMLDVSLQRAYARLKPMFAHLFRGRLS